MACAFVHIYNKMNNTLSVYNKSKEGTPMRNVKRAVLFISMAFVMSACTVDTEKGPESSGSVAEDNAGESKHTEPADAEGNTTRDPAEKPNPTEEDNVTEKERELPASTTLEFYVEGEPQSVPAVLARSELGYALYVMENFEFTPEEPGKDMIFHRAFPEYSARIEVLPKGANVSNLRADAEEALKAVNGDTVDMTNSFFDERIRATAEFILHAGSESGSVTMIVMTIDETLFRITLNFPLTEASEGIPPRFYPMIRSIVVTK
jgi:hypothetical protein